MAEDRRDQLYALLHDPQLYTYSLPKEIQHLILDYLSISVYVLGMNYSNEFGF
jgi:hypothetical protein